MLKLLLQDGLDAEARPVEHLFKAAVVCYELRIPVLFRFRPGVLALLRVT